MGLEERKIGIAQLAAGMYVCRLDRPWNDTPFPLQGFLVESDEQMTWLRAHCKQVWIDVERGNAPADDGRGTLKPQRRAPVDVDSLIGGVRYTDKATFEEELPAAIEARDNAARITTRIMEDVREGHKLSMADVQAAVEPVVQSVLRSADTLFWINALKRDTYAYSHAINCSALAASFGRHLGLPADLLVDLAGGGLLLDVGKAQLPPELLGHPGPLDPPRMEQVRQHVALSEKILVDSGQYTVEVQEMIRTHHERWDGSGYPSGLVGASIPLFGRMAAIIDSFDAMTSERPYSAAIARHVALQQLYRRRDTLFQSELVEQFISCLGVYPTGSLVELSNGEVAVVMAQNPARRLRPRVMVLTDADKQMCEQFTSLDLMVQTEGLPRDQQVNVVRPLPIGAYGLDPAELYL